MFEETYETHYVTVTNKLPDPKCMVCYGEGKLYTGERDPIEGNKMRSVVDCPFCNGVGSFDSKSVKGIAVQAYHEAYFEEEDRRRKEENERARIESETYESAIRKLTAEELDIIIKRHSQ